MRRVEENEYRYVAEVLETGFRTSAGSAKTGALEGLFAQTLGTRFAISFVNGTATLHTALAAAGVGPGDHVIVPPLTMSSTAISVLQAGAVPVFADVDAAAWTLDPASVVERITPQTRAIMPVALYGLSPDLDPMMELARERGLVVIEDDAQCFLGSYKGRMVGTIGHMASFSFQSSKHLTSGEGGMLTTDDPELAEAIRRFGSLGYAGVGAAAGKGKITKDVIQDPAYERHVSLGWNYRMPELCAAVALAQVERIEALVDTRVKAAERYAQVVEGCSWLAPQHTPAGYKHTYWTYVLKVSDEATQSWHEIRRRVIEHGGSSPYGAWQLSYLEPLLRDGIFDPAQPQAYSRGLCPVAESVQPRLLQLKTNLYDDESRAREAEALAAMIDSFGR